MSDHEQDVPLAIQRTTEKNLMVFSGRAHPSLATAIADGLGSQVAPTEAYEFANGELYVRYSESVRGCDAFVIQAHTAPINTWLMEHLIMVDALKRASAKRITVVLPFYGYARQDKKHRGREPISARLMADLFKTAGADRLITVELARSGKSNTLLNRVIALQSIIYALAWPIVLTFAVIAGYGSSVLLTVTLIGLSILPAAISDDEVSERTMSLTAASSCGPHGPASRRRTRGPRCRSGTGRAGRGGPSTPRPGRGSATTPRPPRLTAGSQARPRGSDLLLLRRPRSPAACPRPAARRCGRCGRGCRATRSCRPGRG